MDYPQRKPARLKDYDYSTPGAYFVTVCTKNRGCLFWRAETLSPAVGAAISRPPYDTSPPYSLTDAGKIVDFAIQSIHRIYPAVTVEKYVIMPNHVHLLLQIHAGDGGRLIAAPTISTVVGQMKRWAAKNIGAPLWQRSFYDHVVRSEDEYREIAEYIAVNPVRWAEDRFYVPEGTSG